MGNNFIKSGKGSSEIAKAIRQERQINYLVTSELQDDQVTSDYVQQWAARKYQTNDYFLNYIKSIFNTENFLLFYKFMRKPLPSAKLVNNKIKPQLKRVFNAEDSDYKYEVAGVDESDFIDLLDIDQFDEDLFNSIFKAHNSIVIEELRSDQINTPYRYILDISKVKAIDAKRDGTIKKIAFKAKIKIEEQYKEGILYIDDESYQFYKDQNDNSPIIAPHDLGYCPAQFISKTNFGDSKIVKESIFSYVREELEEYNFLKTLQKMTEPNGAIPIVTKLEAKVEGEEDDNSRGSELEPESEFMMSGQAPRIMSDNPPKASGILQAGTVINVPPVQLDNGSIDMEAVKSFINFHYIPIEALNYLKERISEIERSIISSIVGDVVESSEESKNQLQIEKSISVLENTLNSLADTLNRIRTLSDKSMLDLRYGKDRVKDVFVFFGTDFFLDSQYLLYEALEKAPNAIERKNILSRINQNKYRNNPSQLSRQKLLYDLIPYVSDKDFEVARTSNTVSSINMQYQIRFNYWISQFEATYGDIIEFYKSLDLDKSEKLLLINNLIVQLIKSQTDESNTPTSD